MHYHINTYNYCYPHTCKLNYNTLNGASPPNQRISSPINNRNPSPKHENGICTKPCGTMELA